jgi:hypothetical protein
MSRMNKISFDHNSRSMIDIITCNGTANPMFLFEEYGSLDEDLKDDIKHYCIERGYIPFIDYDHDLQKWIFHSITHGDLIWKRPIAAKYEALDESGFTLESKLERDFSSYLTSLGANVRTQVRCDSGVADIVTENKIYELKHKLNRSSFFSAIGQVLLYRQRINPKAAVAIVCRISLVPELHEVAKELGVEVIVWRK